MELRPAQVKQALQTAIDVQRPAFVWGPPGIGKSDLIAGIAKENGMEIRDVRLNLMDPTDIKGFPIPNADVGHMEWLPADFLPHMTIEKEIETTPAKGKTPAKTEIQRVPNDTKGILFLDELNQAPPMVQAAAYQLLLTRKVGNYELPPGWSMLAAGNRETDRSNAQRMPAALALRLIHLDMTVNADDWCDWAMENSETVPVELLTFIRFRPDLLHNFDASQRVSPNPRSWTFCGEIINKGLPKEVELAMVMGSVGEASAGEFMAYLEVFRDLPTVDQVMLDPDGTPISDKASVQFAITGALAQKTSKDNYPRIKKYIDRMGPEWQIVYTKDAMRNDRGITTTKEFQKFAIAHSQLLG